jgi:hypothetical protein
MFNDYDYCLVHLFEDHKDYFDFYRKSVLTGREVILDNSVFELKKAFDSKKFADWVEKLLPSHFIVPDVLENYRDTTTQYEKFVKEYRRLPGKTIGVIQGKSYHELVSCYKYIQDVGVDKIAISFDYSYYESLFPKLNKLEAWSKGRQQLIDHLLQDGIINQKKPHHLLGCGLATEFAYYKGMKFIDSLDTSNPIVSGIMGLRYNGLKGLSTKPSIKLHHLIGEVLNPKQYKDVIYNVEQFRKITE